MRRKVLLCCFVAMAAAVPSHVNACVCEQSQGLAADVRAAEAVFAGTVVALDVVRDQVGAHNSEDMVATFKVKRRWKGPDKNILRVRTCGTQTMICTCGTDFRLGAHFVVFAVDKPLFTSSCQRTTEYQVVDYEPGMEWLGVEDLVRDLDALVKQGNNK